MNPEFLPPLRDEDVDAIRRESGEYRRALDARLKGAYFDGPIACPDPVTAQVGHGDPTPRAATRREVRRRLRRLVIGLAVLIAAVLLFPVLNDALEPVDRAVTDLFGGVSL